MPAQNDIIEKVETVNPTKKNDDSNPKWRCFCPSKKNKKISVTVGGAFLFVTLIVGPICTAIFSNKNGNSIKNLEINT
jgi:hypothetical protein